jgi:hypothetical protein
MNIIADEIRTDIGGQHLPKALCSMNQDEPRDMFQFVSEEPKWPVKKST